MAFFLRVESGVDAGLKIPLPEGGQDPIALSLGRDALSNVCFGDQTMSRHQAELRWEGGAWHLLNVSKHGSFVGRRRLKVGKQRRLKVGDTLTLGETELSFGEQDGAKVLLDSLTPRAPTVACPPAKAGYDPEGRFHSGQTLLELDREAHRSFLYLLKDDQGGARLTIKRRRVYFLALVSIFGVLGLGLLFHYVIVPTFRAHPQGLLMASGLGLVPAVPYLIFFKLLDRNDQIPWKNLLACAVWGGTVGCGFSLVLNGLGHEVIAEFVGGGAFTTTAVFVAPLIEEVIKGLAVLALFWFLHDEFDNLVEGLILGAASGLGFALVENCIYNLRFLQEGQETFWRLGGYRVVVNALIGHPVYTALTGAGLGLLRETSRSKRTRWLWPFVGLGAAIALHVSWNAAAVYLGGHFSEDLQLITNAVLLGGAGVFVFVAAYVFAARRERRVLVTYLVEEIEAGFVERRELDSFYEVLGRMRYEVEGLRRGWRVYRLRKQLRRAQVELAFRKWHLAQGDAVRGDLGDRPVRTLRDRIRDLRNALARAGETVDRRAAAPEGGSTTQVPPSKLPLDPQDSN